MKHYICPTITALDEEEYRRQILSVSKLTDRLHIDLMDGKFAPTKSPGLDKIWWPHGVVADIHLMYEKPMDELDKLVHLKPSMVIIHAEAEVHHMQFAGELHKEGIKAGLAVLKDTPVEDVYQIMHSFDHILVFSGDLGHHGGTADMSLLDKVKKIHINHREAEIGWDGGINAHNIVKLKEAGVKVFNAGGVIQKADNAKNSYAKLKELIDQ